MNVGWIHVNLGFRLLTVNAGSLSLCRGSVEEMTKVVLLLMLLVTCVFPYTKSQNVCNEKGPQHFLTLTDTTKIIISSPGETLLFKCQEFNQVKFSFSFWTFLKLFHVKCQVASAVRKLRGTSGCEKESSFRQRVTPLSDRRRWGNLSKAWYLFPLSRGN